MKSIDYTKCFAVFCSGTKNRHICDEGARSVSAAPLCAAEDGDTVSHTVAGTGVKITGATLCMQSI